MTDTTDLDTIRKHGHLFTWGRVLNVHDIGQYTIVKYDERAMNSRALTGKIRFHVYVDGEDQRTSAATLDGAILLAVAIARLGVNEGGSAASFMCRALGVER